MDVERLSAADVWRQVSGVAGGLGLFRPGYHSVLALVLDERRRRADLRDALEAAFVELWAYKGTDYAKLARRLSETRRP